MARPNRKALEMDAYTAAADAVALVAATAKTILQVATPATTRAVLREVQVSFDGVSATAVPALVEILTQTTAGTMTAVTPTPHDPAAPASPATAAKAATAEPTAGAVIKSFRLTPYGGIMILRFDLNEGIRIPASGRVGIRVTAAAAVNVNAYATFEV